MPVENILYLAHRIPYPPNKGDKIRSYHVLRYLAERYNVYLGAFIDDPRDWRHVEKVQRWTRQSRFLPLKPRTANIRSLTGLLKGDPLTLPYYRDRRMSEWVGSCMDTNPVDAVFVYSSSMAQYVQGPRFEHLRRVIDFVDMDSDKWQQYASSRPWPLSWIYRREGKRLEKYETRVAGEFDAAMFVSRSEAEMFTSRLGGAGSIGYYDNGVDWNYFSPRPESDSPYPDKAQVLVFTGAMDYWANVDAVSWFASAVFPQIRQHFSDARFYIVGTRPTEAVRRLERLQGVRVTGAVDDIRPYMEHAHAAVAPLRIARGVQNKVLEAMSMAKPVIATPQALEGIDFAVGENLRMADSVDDFVAAAADFLGTRRASPDAREWVRRRYDWDANLARLGQSLDPGSGQLPQNKNTA